MFTLIIKVKNTDMKEKIFMDAVDIHAITGYSMGHCRKIIRKIKETSGKLKHQKVTVEEVSKYLGVSPEQLRQFYRKAG